MRIVRYLACLGLVLFTAASVSAMAGKELLMLANQMERPELDETSARGIAGASLTLRDMKIYFDTGQIVFLKPLRIDSADVPYGALFIGKGRFLFQPPIAMERQQLRRFLKSDSLHREFASMVLLFDTTVYRRLLNGAGVPATMLAGAPGKLKELHGEFKEYKDREMYYQTLLSLLQPAAHELLVTVSDLKETGMMLFHQLPYEREQMGLLHKEFHTVYDLAFQTICSYPLEANELTGEYNGTDHSPLQAQQYDIDASIKSNGKMEAITRVHLAVDAQPTSVLSFYLDPEMEVDSILDRSGKLVAFGRYKDDDYYYGLWLMPDAPSVVGDSLVYTFFYSGDVAEKELGQYFVFAGAMWYPRHGFRQEATFDVRIKSPAYYTLIASGELVDSTRIKDTLFTHWTSTVPASNMSFNIGIMKHYNFSEPDLVPVDIYFSEDLHRSIATSLGAELIPVGSHMERQVAGDIQNSLKLFERLFGPYRGKNIVVSELLASHSEAFPAFLHMRYDTWISTDAWGFDRMHRAHEVAHQWWGVAVGYETYHDQWLSEGFATYSAFLYLQQAAGNDQFLDRLNDYRGDIMVGRENQGAVALGHRAGNLRDEEHGYIVLYQKGAFVLHMLRNLLIDLQTMKEDAFFALMREFYQTYSHRNATTQDFKRMVEKYAGQDMTWFFDQWVYNNYVPTYNCSYEVVARGDAQVLKIRIEQKNVPESFKMYLPVEIELAKENKGYLRFLVDKPVIEREIQLPAKPKKVRFNPFHSVLAEIKQ